MKEVGTRFVERKVRTWGRVIRKFVLKDCQCLKFFTLGPVTMLVGRTCRCKGVSEGTAWKPIIGDCVLGERRAQSLVDIFCMRSSRGFNWGGGREERLKGAGFEIGTTRRCIVDLG